MQQAEDVLAFWFEEVKPEQRFKRDDALDAMIRQRFEALHARLASEVPAAWRTDGHTLLAAILVLDQFSRNLFRDDPRAYAQDDTALALAKEAITRGLDRGLGPDERQFLYMPFMHAEVLAEVERCIVLMASIPHEESTIFAQRHRDPIALFGRYPARNAALGRETTADEATFLASHPAGF